MRTATLLCNVSQTSLREMSRKKVKSCKKQFAIESPTASKKPYRYFALCCDPNTFPFRCQNIFWRTSNGWDVNFTIPWNTNIFSNIFGEFVASGIQSVSLCQYSTLEENWMPPQFIQKIRRIFWLQAEILEFALSFMAHCAAAFRIQIVETR